MPRQSPKSSGRSGKSSKTARVLNLLTDPESIDSPAEPDAPLSAADGVKSDGDRRSQDNIRGALEGALERELSEAAPARPKRPRGAKGAFVAASTTAAANPRGMLKKHII